MGRPKRLKTVPAKIEGVEVGQAHLYEDASVEVVFYKDADPEKMQVFRDLIGDNSNFSIGKE